VHLVDTVLRAGQGGGHFQLPDLPMTPGREVAGIIDEVGEGVDERWLGLRVVAHLGPASGGYAEFAVTSIDGVHALADSVSEPAAVAMVGTGRMTMGILEVAQLRPDDVVLVTAAAGGIGTLLVQAAHHLGATVVGVAGGPAKVRRVRESGADVAVDYTAPDWIDAVRKGIDGQEVSVALDGARSADSADARRPAGAGGTGPG
jgi:NADPH2:quinone reductase